LIEKEDFELKFNAISNNLNIKKCYECVKISV